MKSLNELLQDYVNKPYEELLAFAKISMSKLVDEMKSVFGEDESIANAYMVITSACLGVDGRLTALEYRFLKDLLESDMDYETMKNGVETYCGQEAMDLTDRLADSLSSDGKSALIMYCLSFLAVDETISRDEVAFIRKLIEE